MIELVRPLSRLLLLAVCFVLASCIDGREEYWVGANGSGRAVLHYEIPSTVVRYHGGDVAIVEMLDQFVRETPALKNASHRISRNGDRTVVDFTASFDSVMDLIDQVAAAVEPAAESEPAMVDYLIGRFDVLQKGRSLEITRTISPSKALPGAFLMPASRFKGRHLVYIIHLPVAARDSNALRTEDGGRTLVWDKSLEEDLGRNVVIHIGADMPVPWARLSAAAAVIATLGWLAIRRMRRGKRSVT